MNTDYGEIICKAVDEIVSAKLQGLQYDITKLCTIVDDTYSYQGKYTVSDGTARYDAFTTDVSLKKGNQVQVTIPNGDYSMQKTILGRIATTDTTPFNYTSPLDTMIIITNDVFESAKTIYGENEGLLANGSRKLLGPIYSLEGEKELAGYTRLGLSADFRSWLNGLDVISGSYGIKVLLYTDIIEQATGTAVSEVVYELTFSSADMVGNPYWFDDYFSQEKVFDISNITNIKRLEVYFYQDSMFLDGTGNKVPHQDSDTLLGLVDKPNNLFVKNVQLYMGYETGYFQGETLILYTPDILSYSQNRKEENKEIDLRWVHKIDDKNYEIINSNNFDSNEYEIRWFKYNLGYETIDQYAGKDWELIQTNGFMYSLAPDHSKQTEQIKVVGLIKGEASDENVQDITPYFSNLLTFTNEQLVPDQTTLKAATALSIYCEDQTEGNYLLYDQNGKLINEGLGKGYLRYFKAMYQGAEITEDIGTVDWVKWYFPIENTMLLTTEEMYSAEKGNVSNREYKYKGVDYVEITRENAPSVEQQYSIENVWSSQKNNNTILCRISISGIEYEAIEELRFGKAGTNGTNVSFLIEFDGSVNALSAGSSESVIVRPYLYTEANGAANGLPTGAQVSWEWYKRSNSDYISMSPSLDSSYCSLVCRTNTVPNDNYFILKATYEGLEAYLPIPIKNNCAFIEGAREIIYDHQGIPNYYNDAYTCWVLGSDGYEEIKGTWQLRYDEDQEFFDKGYVPSLVTSPNRNAYKVLQAPGFYIQGGSDKVCVSLPNYWSQPILILQSKYDFAMLNEWDGNLKIDEDNSTILATMLGAGRKNSDNTFSGVLIGDIQTGSGLQSANSQTGVYGLHHGELSYALKEDGSATFGKKGKGQIAIDGEKGTIQSADYANNNGGMLIDLDDGIIDIQETEQADTSKIAFRKGEKTLLNVGANEYFLQSNNYADSDLQGNPTNYFSGTKIDLSNGKILIGNGLDAGSIRLGSDSISTNGKEEKYLFCVASKDKTPLVVMGEEDYYLQSSKFTRQQQVVEKQGNVEYRKFKAPYQLVCGQSGTSSSGALLTVSAGTIIWVDTNKNVYAGSSLSSKTAVNFTSISWSYIVGEDSKDESKNSTSSSADVKAQFLNALVPVLEAVDTPTGLKIDLNKGTIVGYDLYLSGINSANKNNQLIIDTSAVSNPLSIGENFRVDWDGSVVCNKLTSLKNDNPSGNIIQIGEHFYVNGNSVGGSQWQGSCSGYAGGVYGYSPQTITSGGRTYYVLGK